MRREGGTAMRRAFKLELEGQRINSSTHWEVHHAQGMWEFGWLVGRV